MTNWRNILDWRQKVAALYQPISSSGSLEREWAGFVAARRTLIHSHAAAMSVPDADAPHYFVYNPAFALQSHFEAIDAGSSYTVSGGYDGPISFKAIARSIELSPMLGCELTLYWLEQYGGGLFLPFKDASCGTATYAGGRYLIDSVKSAFLGISENGALRLDFNYSYFPSCAHDDRYICPLSPLENTLPVFIAAGECWHQDTVAC